MRVMAVAAPFLAAILAGLNSGCGSVAQSADAPELSGYTCCNFHYEHDRISDANWSSLPMIPAGTPIRTLSYSRYRIAVQIDYPFYASKMDLGLDYGRDQNMADWARRMIVQEDPRRKLASWPAPARSAVGAGKVAIGMTREQVIVSLGYPPAHETPSLDAEHWKYWYGKFDTFSVVWDQQERVREVYAEPQVRSAVMQ